MKNFTPIANEIKNFNFRECKPGTIAPIFREIYGAETVGHFRSSFIRNAMDLVGVAVLQKPVDNPKDAAQGLFLLLSLIDILHEFDQATQIKHLGSDLDDELEGCFFRFCTVSSLITYADNAIAFYNTLDVYRTCLDFGGREEGIAAMENIKKVVIGAVAANLKED